jgi:processive 1,2-diacylglycerol beta-glucosyltransferase
MGCGSVPDTARGLLDGDPDATVCVICGKNEKLKNELSDAPEAASGRLIPVGFTTEVASYMSAADVLISKPGGISSTEAAVCGVPFVQSVSIPGCETKNARFFSERGMSLSTKDPEEAVKLAVSLMGDEGRRERMSSAQRATINPHAAEDIVKYVTGE